MSRIFIDTGFVIALINTNDFYHAKALQLAERFSAYPAVTTDAVLFEIGNALSRTAKQQAVDIINYFKESHEISIIFVDSLLFDKGLTQFARYKDKTWGLVDCISFVVMQEQGITEALTFDKHFSQAGFTMLE